MVPVWEELKILCRRFQLSFLWASHNLGPCGMLWSVPNSISHSQTRAWSVLLLPVGLALREMFNFSVMVCLGITMSANMWAFSKYVVSRNFEFYSVAGKQNLLCFLVIFSKALCCCNACFGCFHIQRYSIPPKFKDIEHYVTPRSVPQFSLVVWL